MGRRRRFLHTSGVLVHLWNIYPRRPSSGVSVHVLPLQYPTLWSSWFSTGPRSQHQKGVGISMTRDLTPKSTTRCHSPTKPNPDRRRGLCCPAPSVFFHPKLRKYFGSSVMNRRWKSEPRTSLENSRTRPHHQAQSPSTQQSDKVTETIGQSVSLVPGILTQNLFQKNRSFLWQEPRACPALLGQMLPKYSRWGFKLGRARFCSKTQTHYR